MGYGWRETVAAYPDQLDVFLFKERERRVFFNENLHPPEEFDNVY